MGTTIERTCTECGKTFKPKGGRATCYECKPAAPRANHLPSDGTLYNRGTDKDPLWWGRLHFRGKEQRFAIGRMTKKAAREALRQKRDELAQGVHIAGDERRVTLGDLADAVRRDYRDRGFRSTDTAEYILAHLVGYFGAMTPVLSVGFHEISQYREHRRALVAPPTINRECAMLRKGYALLHKTKRISRVPDFPEAFPESEPRQGFVDLGAMLSIKAELPEALRDPWAFGFWSAWRKGEVFGLRWSWVDLAANEIRLPGSSSKNKSPRVLPLFAQVRDILERRHAQRVPFCDLVFHRNGRPIAGDVHHTVTAAAKRAGHPGRLWHDLRRSGVRNLVRAGVSQRVAMAWSGHKTAAVFARYDITSNDDLHEAARKLEAHMQGQSKAPARKVVRIKGRKVGS